MLLSCTGGLLLRYNFAMSRMASLLLRYNFAMSRMASRTHRPFLNRQL